MRLCKCCAVAIAIGCVMLSGCSTNEESQNNSIESKNDSVVAMQPSTDSSSDADVKTIHVDYPIYDSVSSLSDASDLAIRCSLKSTESVVFEGNPYTRVTVNVEEIYRGNAKVGNTLTFLQLGTNEAEKNPVISDNYVAMKQNQEYVLFLTKSGEEYFMPSPAQSCYLWAEGDKTLSPVLDSSVALSVKAEDLK